MKTSLQTWLRSLDEAIQAKSDAVATCLIAAFGVAVILAPDLALAQTNFGSGQNASTIANNIITSISGFSKVVNAFCYIAATVMGAVAVAKFKANSENHQQTPLKIPLTFLGVAAGFAAVPEVIGTGIVSVWGSGAKTVSPTGV